jgi:hypothetical protein
MLSINDIIKNPLCLNCYPMGSVNYGSSDKLSDKDWIIIWKEFNKFDDPNIHCYTVEEFQKQIDSFEITALESIMLPKDRVLKETAQFNFSYTNSPKEQHLLRKSISTISSHSWVKGQKKLTVIGDYDVRNGLKSLYHSIRILDYGIQIAQWGVIKDWEHLSWFLLDLKKLSENHTYNDLWQAIDTKYRLFKNEKLSLFKKLAPKDLEETSKSIQLSRILKKWNINNPQLESELLQLL